MTIYDFDNYNLFLRAWIQALPRKGRGWPRKLALHLKVHPTLISQVLQAKKDLTPEQAQKTGELMELASDEVDYLIVLVELARAGTQDLRDYKKRQLQNLKKKFSDLRGKIQNSKELDEFTQRKYYSRWEYGAIRLLSHSEKYRSLEAVSKRLGLSYSLTEDLVHFLIQNGLLEKDEQGFLKATGISTFVGKESPHRVSHLRNWLQQAIRQQEMKGSLDISLTAPVMISLEDAEILKNRILDFIQAFTKTAEKSPSEELFCLNLSWHKPDC